jgi:CzcA family heavy metal efflux pump
MHGLVGAILKFRFVIVALAGGLLILGFTLLRDMPVDVLPEFSPPYVEIQTESLGLSAEEVEQMITVPMEHDLLAGVPWVETVRSESVPGLSSIVLIFRPGTNLLQARQMVSERMTQAVALPHVSKPPTMLQPLSSTGRVIIVGLSSKTLSPIEMGVLARWTIAPRLMGVPGVANVAVWGQHDRQLQVLVDPRRLREQKIPLTTILETTGNALWVSTLSFVEASTPGTGGFIDTPNQRLGIMHISPIITASGLAQVPISDLKKSDGTPLRLSDVANVVEDHQPLIGDAVVNDDSGLLLVIDKFPGANTLAVTHGIDGVLEQLKPGLPGMTVDTSIYRPAAFIEKSLGNLSGAVLLGYALVVLALGTFKRSWRIALISAAVIPVSLVTASLVLYLQGASMNVMVLAGLLIALSVVVDDVVICVDNVARRLRMHREMGGTTSISNVILEASVESRSAVVLASLITAAIVVPIFLIGGEAGAIFGPLALAYGLAVLASLVVAVTITPALCLILLPNDGIIARREPQPMRRLRQGLEAVLERTIHQRWLAIVTVASMVVVGLAVLPMSGQALLPRFEEPYLLIHMDGAPGTSQPEMSRIVTRISHELQSIPGVHEVGAHVGRAVLGDQVVGANSTELWVRVDPAADYDKTVASVRDVVRGFPGFNSNVTTYLQQVSSNVTAKPRNSITTRIYGATDEVLRSKATDVQKAITGIDGIFNLHVNLPVQELTLETEVDIAKAQRYGLKPGDVRRAAATLFSGIQVGNLFEDQKIFDVVVWSTPETRHSINAVGDLLIDTPDGGTVRLGDVAQVRVVPTAADVRHESDKRYLDVVADVQGRDLSAVAADVKAHLGQVGFPLEYHAEVLGDYQALQDAQFRLVGVGIFGLIGIFFLMQAALDSWRLAAMSFVILPAALAGGVLAAFATGDVISVGSLAGLLAVFGIAARNGIKLINHYRHLEPEEGEAFGSRLVLQGTGEQLSSILVTALATGLAFVPALLFGDIPGLEIIRPMAIAILGGLITSTFLNLLVMPTLYLSLATGQAHSPERYPVDGATRNGAVLALTKTQDSAAGG